jgi:hypothetical protein
MKTQLLTCITLLSGDGDSFLIIKTRSYFAFERAAYRRLLIQTLGAI